MYTLTDKEKKFLQDFASSQDGLKMKKLLENIARAADSVTGIKGDYAAQVEGRQILKKVIEEITAQMVPSRQARSSAQSDVDDEWL